MANHSGARAYTSQGSRRTEPTQKMNEKKWVICSSMHSTKPTTTTMANRKFWIREARARCSIELWRIQVLARNNNILFFVLSFWLWRALFYRDKHFFASHSTILNNLKFSSFRMNLRFEVAARTCQSERLQQISKLDTYRGRTFLYRISISMERMLSVLLRPLQKKCVARASPNWLTKPKVEREKNNNMRTTAIYTFVFLSKEVSRSCQQLQLRLVNGTRKIEEKQQKSRIKRTSFTDQKCRENFRIESTKKPKLMPAFRALAQQRKHHYAMMSTARSHRVTFKRVCGAHYIQWNKFKSYPKQSAEQ